MQTFLKTLFIRSASISALAITLSTGTAHAAPVEFAALITPKADVTLRFEDGSNRLVRLVQREGETRGGGPLDSTTMLEWGMHELTSEKGNGQGYLVFTHDSGDIAYLRFDWQARMLQSPSGSLSPKLAGSWDIVGGTGRFAALKGVGSLRIEVRSARERYWVFEGDIQNDT